MSKGKLVVISGASGVGKGTVLGIMMEKRKDLKFSVSATTRAPRPSETDGVHYYFVTKEAFEKWLPPVRCWNTVSTTPTNTAPPVPRRRKKCAPAACCWTLNPLVPVR